MAVMAPAPLQASQFEGNIDGKPVALYTLRNAQGMLCCITNYGAKILQLLVPNRDGRLGDVVLGYDSLAAVIDGSPSMGAFIGRYAGRLDGSTFALDGVRHQLTANDGPHCLHGGIKGSRYRVFDAVQRDSASVNMRYVFTDGEEGFPGELALDLTYTLADTNELVLSYEATALDKPTVASFTSHAFFNLNGHASGSVMGHDIIVYADQFFTMRDDMVATGELLAVGARPFYFRQPSAIDAHGLGGYDCCFLLRQSADKPLRLAAQVSAHASGRRMQVWTTEPAMQLYTGQVANQPLAGGLGKEGCRYLQQQSLCLEPQGWPNAPNLMHLYPASSSAVHTPQHSRSGKTVYRFSIFR